MTVTELEQGVGLSHFRIADLREPEAFQSANGFVSGNAPQFRHISPRRWSRQDVHHLRSEIPPGIAQWPVSSSRQLLRPMAPDLPYPLRGTPPPRGSLPSAEWR